MATSIARVGSVALTELKTDLTRLSRTLHQIYELMNADMRQVNAAWQDGKYQEFVQNYQPQIQKCEEIANRYADWCTRVLDPTIENVISVERTDVGGGGGSVGGTGAAGVVSGTAAVSAAETGKSSDFNMKGSSTPQKVVPRPGTKDFTDPNLDYCGDGQHKELKSYTMKQSASHTSPTWDVGAEGGGEIGVTGPKVKAGIFATRHSSKESNTVEFTGNYECVPDKNE